MGGKTQTIEYYNVSQMFGDSVPVSCNMMLTGAIGTVHAAIFAHGSGCGVQEKKKNADIEQHGHTLATSTGSTTWDSRKERTNQVQSA